MSKSKIAIVVLALSASSVWALGLKPEVLASMTYSQCRNDPTVQFLAGYYRQQRPNISQDTMLHLICRDAGKKVGK